MFLDNAMERINRLILQGGRTGMTENQFFAAEIKEWKNSQRRKDQVMGDLYYEGLPNKLNFNGNLTGLSKTMFTTGRMPNVKNGQRKRLIRLFGSIFQLETKWLPVGHPAHRSILAGVSA